MTYVYKVLGTQRKVSQGRGTEKARSEIEQTINNFSLDGWSYIGQQPIDIRVSKGCLGGLMGQDDHLETHHFMVFRRPAHPQNSPDPQRMEFAEIPKTLDLRSSKPQATTTPPNKTTKNETVPPVNRFAARAPKPIWANKISWIIAGAIFMMSVIYTQCFKADPQKKELQYLSNKSVEFINDGNIDSAKYYLNQIMQKHPFSPESDQAKDLILKLNNK